MLTTLILCALVAKPQTVTFTHPCARAEVVLEALGKEIGLTLKPSGSVSQDYLLLKFNGVALNEAFDKMSSVLNAQWTVKGGVYYLGRSRVQETAEFYGEYAEKARAIRKSLAKLGGEQITKESARQLAIQFRDTTVPDKASQYETLKPLFMKLPGHQALIKIVSLMNLDEIVLAEETLIGFSDTELSLPYPIGSEKVFEELAHEWATFAEQATQEGVQLGIRYADAYSQNIAAILADREMLQISAMKTDTGINFSFSTFHENKLTFLGSLFLTFSEIIEIPAWIQSIKSKARLSPLATASVIDVVTENESTLLLDSFTQANPEDILLSAASEVVITTTNDKGVSVVALFPDSCYSSLLRQKVPREPTASSLLSAMIQSNAIKCDLNDKWLEVRPSEPYSQRRRRLDRRAFSNMVRKAALKSSIPLESFCEFALTTNHDDPIEIASYLINKSFHRKIRIPNYNVNSLRIYGLLSEAERLEARTDGFFLTGRLDSDRFAHHIDSDNSLHETNTTNLTMKRPFDEERSARARIVADEIWKFTVIDKPFFVIRYTSENSGLPAEPLDLETFASVLEGAERTGKTEYDLGAIGSLRGTFIKLNRVFSESGEGGGLFTRYVDPLANPVLGSFGELPDDIRKLVEEALALRRKETAEKQKGGGGK